MLAPGSNAPELYAYPPTKMMDHKNCTAMGIRYEPESVRSLVELFTMAARNKPMVMASWYVPTTVPRIHFGAVSDWYMGTANLLALEDLTIAEASD